MQRALITLAGLLAAGMAFAQANVAPGGVATQSSTYRDGDSGRANDGNTDGNWYNSSVSHTESEHQPWWQVALGAEHAVAEVVVWNRIDCCAGRLSDYTVSLWNDGALVGSRFFAGTSLDSQAFSFGGQVADSVRVQLSGTDYLSLAEVQVFASPVPEPHAWALMLGGLGLGLAGAAARRRAPAADVA